MSKEQTPKEQTVKEEMEELQAPMEELQLCLYDSHQLRTSLHQTP